jgi:quinolinate synthase
MTIANALESSTSMDEIRSKLRERLHEVMPDFEIDAKAEIAHQVNLLKKEMNAVILGHNYMEPALYHSVPDYVGDSLHLSAVSAKTDADIIVFCGVWFMGETAKVLNPQKTVLVPSDKAGCSLAAGINASDVQALKAKYPDVPIVSYVNTYADVKVESDYCCTSGNASKVLSYLLEKGHKRIIFLPDEFLARNTAAEMGIAYAPVLDDEAVAALDPDVPAALGWKIRCEVHELFTPQDVDNIHRQFPGTVVLAHPECSPEVIEKADVSGSTKVMVDYIEKVEAPRYALLTECSMGDNMAGQFPHREMIRSCSLRCQHMNQISLEDTLAALQQIRYKVELDDAIIEGARKPIDRMLEIR